MTPQEIKENAKKYVLQSWSKQATLNPIPVEKAEGIYFYDADKKYIGKFFKWCLEKGEKGGKKA